LKAINLQLSHSMLCSQLGTPGKFLVPKSSLFSESIQVLKVCLIAAWNNHILLFIVF